MGKTLVIKGADFSANGWKETFFQRMSLFGVGLGNGVNVNGYKARISAFCLRNSNEVPLKITAPTTGNYNNYSKSELETLLGNNYTYCPISGNLRVKIVCKNGYQVTVNTINAAGELIALGTAASSIDTTYDGSTVPYISILFKKGETAESWENSIDDVCSTFEVTEV